jgi:hypothetical protein
MIVPAHLWQAGMITNALRGMIFLKKKKKQTGNIPQKRRVYGLYVENSPEKTGP